MKEVLDQTVVEVTPSNSPQNDEKTTKMTLGAVVNFSFDGVCELSKEYHKKILSLLQSNVQKKFYLSCTLQPAGSTQNKVQLNKLKIHHCEEKKTCLLIDEEGYKEEDENTKSTNHFTFEVTPEVINMSHEKNQTPSLSLELKVRGQTQPLLSAEISILSLLNTCEERILNRKIALRNSQDKIGGFLNTTIRYGDKQKLLTGSVSSKCNVLEPIPAKVVIQVLEVSNIQNSNTQQLFVELGSSSCRNNVKKSNLLLIPPGKASSPWESSLSFELKSSDLWSDLFFIDLLRYSEKERNQRIGSCSFSLSWILEDIQREMLLSGQTVNIEKTVCLTSPPKDTVRAPLNANNTLLLACVASSNGPDLRLKISIVKASVTEEVEEDEQLSAADVMSASQATLGASGIKCPGGAKHLVDSSVANAAGVSGILNISILEMLCFKEDTYLLPEKASGVDIFLKIPSATWSVESSMKRISSKGRENKLEWKAENALASLRWSTKERIVPTLIVEIRQRDKNSVTSGQDKEDTTRPTFARAEIDLSSFLMHPNYPTRTWINVASSISTMPAIPLLLQMEFRSQNQSIENGVPKVQSTLQVKGQLYLNLQNALNVRPINGVKGHGGSYFVKAMCSASSVIAHDQELTLSDGKPIVKWNEHLVLNIEEPTGITPILSLEVYEGSVESENQSLVGFLNVPLLPYITEHSHLASFSLPIIADGKKQGTLNFEAQFLSLELAQRALISQKKNDHQLRLTIQELRRSPECTLLPTFTKNVMTRISLVGATQTELLFESSTVSVASSRTLWDESCEIVLPQDPEVSATSLLLVELCDESRQVYGCLHLSLRDKSVFHSNRWYKFKPLTTGKAKGPSKSIPSGTELRISLESGQQKVKQIDDYDHSAQFVVVEILSASHLVTQSSNVYVEFDMHIPESENEERYKLRTQVDRTGTAQRYQRFVLKIPQPSCTSELRFRLISEQSSTVVGTASLVIPSHPNSRCFEYNFDEWLKIGGGNQVTNGLLHVRGLKLPALNGDFDFRVINIINLSDEDSTQTPVLRNLYVRLSLTCEKQKSVSTSVQEVIGREQVSWENHSPLRLRYTTIGSTKEKEDNFPLLRIQLMHRTMAGPQVCLGEHFLELTSTLQRSQDPTLDSPVSNSWCTLTSPTNTTANPSAKICGLVQLQLQFIPSQLIQQNSTSSKVTELTPAFLESSATSQNLALWKKLFYMLDLNQNQVIDLMELKQALLQHAEVFWSTKDGKQLLHTLFGKKEVDEDDLETEIELLFAEMDTNQDNQVEWKEYVAFLLKKQMEISSGSTLIVTTLTKTPMSLNATSISSGEEKLRSKILALESLLRLKNQEIQTLRLVGHKNIAPSSPIKELNPLNTIKPLSLAVDKSINHTRTTRIAKSSALSSATFVPIPPSTPLSNNNSTLPQLTRTSKADYQIQSQVETLQNEKKYMQRYHEAELESIQGALQKIQEEMKHTKDTNQELLAQIASYENVIHVHEQRYASLQKDYEELHRQQHKNLLDAQKRELEKQTRQAFLQAEIQRQTQVLKERESMRMQQNAASILLQSKVRARLEQKRYQAVKFHRAQAATKIQCFYRSKHAKTILNTLKMKHQMEIEQQFAAEKLQKFTKKQLARKQKEIELQSQHLAGTLIQSRWHGHQQYDTFQSQKKAARRIQRWFRSFYWQKRLFKSVRKIQFWWRYVFRKWVEHEAEKIEAAMCIQAIWRGKKIRQHIIIEGPSVLASDTDDLNHIQPPQSKTNGPSSEEEDMAAIKIQKLYLKKKHIGRRRQQEENKQHGDKHVVETLSDQEPNEESVPIGDQEEEQGAVMIQRMVRRTLNQPSSVDYKENEPSTDLIQAQILSEEDEASRKIQSFMRKKLQNSTEEVPIQEQVIVEEQEKERNVTEDEKAAIKIQQMVRNKRCSTQQKTESEDQEVMIIRPKETKEKLLVKEEEQAAITIQRAIRKNMSASLEQEKASDDVPVDTESTETAKFSEEEAVAALKIQVAIRRHQNTTRSESTIPVLQDSEVDEPDINFGENDPAGDESLPPIQLEMDEQNIPTTEQLPNVRDKTLYALKAEGENEDNINDNLFDVKLGDEGDKSIPASMESDLISADIEQEKQKSNEVTPRDKENTSSAEDQDVVPDLGSAPSPNGRVFYSLESMPSMRLIRAAEADNDDNDGELSRDDDDDGRSSVNSDDLLLEADEVSTWEDPAKRSSSSRRIISDISSSGSNSISRAKSKKNVSNGLSAVPVDASVVTIIQAAEENKSEVAPEDRKVTMKPIENQALDPLSVANPPPTDSINLDKNEKTKTISISLDETSGVEAAVETTNSTLDTDSENDSESGEDSRTSKSDGDESDSGSDRSRSSSFSSSSSKRSSQSENSGGRSNENDSTHSSRSSSRSSSHVEA